MSSLVPSYYSATANPAPARPALAGETSVDACVIGGGLTGLSAALHLAERGYKTLLLEAEQVGWGASGRNGGQLNTGLRKGASELIQLFGRDGPRRSSPWRRKPRRWCAGSSPAMHRLRSEAGLPLCRLQEERSAWMAEEVELLHKVFGHEAAELLSKAEVEERLGSRRYFGGIADRSAAHLHPLNFVLGLAAAAEAAGARISEQSRVLKLAPGEVTTSAGRVKTRFIVLGCNAYLGALEPRIAGMIMPISNYIVATEPLGEAVASALIRDDVAVCDTKFVVDYFRLSADRRLLFGGGETYSSDPPRDIAGFVRPIC
jgi:Glycine/D-amino acid oxidases (deaminating)